MSCKHYERGQCLAQSREVIRSKWIGLLFVPRTETEWAACAYSEDVWVGNMCVPGRISEKPVSQKDCDIYTAMESPAASLATIADHRI